VSRRPRRGTLGAAVVLLCALAGPAPAQDRAADARREGKVGWYTVMALKTAERVARLFERAHPGIQVEVNRAGSERLLQRLLHEASAGIRNCDVFETGDSGHIVLLKRRRLLARYAPAGSERAPAAFQDKDQLAFAWRAFAVVLEYDARLVPKREAPTTWKDLLDPKWKGKLVTAHPGYAASVVSQVAALVDLYGWDYWKALARQKPLLVQSVHDPFQTILSGERAIAVNGADYYAWSQRRRGQAGDVEIVYPRDGVPFVPVHVGVIATAPRPAAGRLFIDFLFSRPIQQLMADEEGSWVVDPDVAYPRDRPRLADLKLLRLDPDDLERRSEEIKRRFAELFGA
jgi:iron(III) transport system substrate-binding protein